MKKLLLVFVMFASITFGSFIQIGNDIDGEAAGDISGSSVALSSDGTIVAIGAPNAATFKGDVRLFQWDGVSWNQLGNDIDGEASADSSGISVALSSDGTIVAIGANGNDGNGDNSGHVRLYSPDSDDDGLSDFDEINTYFTNLNNSDSDDDGLNDGDEINTYSTDPNDADSDDDGLTDGDEVNTYSTDPNDADSDDDGLTDGDEINTYSTDPNDADSDDDGFNDGDEVSGLDPTTPNTDIFNSVESKMKDLRIGSQTFSVSNGNAKIRMYVDESGNLTDWTNTPHVLELDIPADADTKFFRFRMD